MNVLIPRCFAGPANRSRLDENTLSDVEVDPVVPEAVADEEEAVATPGVVKKRKYTKKNAAANEDSQAGKSSASGPLVPVHVLDDDELDVFLEANLSVFRDKAFSRLATKSVRKAFLKLVLEGDLLEVSLDEQQLLASLWYLLYRKNRVHIGAGGQSREKGQDEVEGASATSSEEVTDSELEISSGESDWHEDDGEGAEAGEGASTTMAKGDGEIRRGRGPGAGNNAGKKIVSRTLMVKILKIQTNLS